ncbi:MAG: hypothetical protein Q9163_001198 [Psora crenata]
MALDAMLPEFQNLDNESVYETYYQALQSIKTLNFVVELDSTSAHAAFDLNTQSLQRLLDIKRPKGSSMRWINIFAPEKQRDCIAAIARKYDFSPRLEGLMSSKPLTPRRVHDVSMEHPASTRQMNGSALKGDRVSTKIHVTDPEKSGLDSECPVELSELDLSHYKIVDEVWHYIGLCIGYNSLSGMSVNSPAEVEDDEHMRTKWSKRKDRKRAGKEKSDQLGNHLKTNPDGKRVWTWLILCDDDTVISIHENPFPCCESDLDLKDAKVLALIRRNLRNVFKQLSVTNRVWLKENPINALDIRPSLSVSQTTTASISDSASLLFYYLFDDWYTSYALVARKEQQYADVLNGLVRDLQPYKTGLAAEEV